MHKTLCNISREGHLPLLPPPVAHACGRPCWQNFHEDTIGSFPVNLLTGKQTDKQTNAGYNNLAGGSKWKKCLSCEVKYHRKRPGWGRKLALHRHEVHEAGVLEAGNEAKHEVSPRRAWSNDQSTVGVVSRRHAVGVWPTVSLQCYAEYRGAVPRHGRRSNVDRMTITHRRPAAIVETRKPFNYNSHFHLCC